MILNKVLIIFIFFNLILSAVYLNQGCIRETKPTPTPFCTYTPRPTWTPEPTETPTPTVTPEPTIDPKLILIVPGKSVSYATIGETNMKYIEEWLGEPFMKTPMDDKFALIYENGNISFVFDQKTRLLEIILIDNSVYKTKEGIGVGSSIVDAMEYYDGVLDEDEEEYNCGYEGISFDYDMIKGDITSIVIFKPWKKDEK